MLSVNLNHPQIAAITIGSETLRSGYAVIELAMRDEQALSQFHAHPDLQWHIQGLAAIYRIDYRSIWLEANHYRNPPAIFYSMNTKVLIANINIIHSLIPHVNAIDLPALREAIASLYTIQLKITRDFSVKFIIILNPHNQYWHNQDIIVAADTILYFHDRDAAINHLYYLCLNGAIPIHVMDKLLTEIPQQATYSKLDGVVCRKSLAGHIKSVKIRFSDDGFFKKARQSLDKLAVYVRQGNFQPKPLRITGDAQQSIQQKMEEAKKILLAKGLLAVEDAELFMKEFMTKKSIPSLMELALIKSLDNGTYFIHASLKSRAELLLMVEARGLLRQAAELPMSTTQQMLLKLANEFKSIEYFEAVLKNPPVKSMLLKTFHIRQFLKSNMGHECTTMEELDSILQNPQKKFALFDCYHVRKFLANKIEIEKDSAATAEPDSSKTNHKRLEPNSKVFDNLAAKKACITV